MCTTKGKKKVAFEIIWGTNHVREEVGGMFVEADDSLPQLVSSEAIREGPQLPLHLWPWIHISKQLPEWQPGGHHDRFKKPEGFTVSPSGLRPSSQRYDSETKSWLTTVFSCWAAPSGAGRAVARPPGEQLSRCVPRTRCTVKADAPYWAATADRTAACCLAQAAAEYQEIRARQHLREGKKPGNTIMSQFIILLKQIHPHRVADIALLRPIWWMESCLGRRAGSVSWYRSTHT